MKARIKYAAIFVKRETYSIAYICKFFGASQSGYYAWIKGKDRADKDDALKIKS